MFLAPLLRRRQKLLEPCKSSVLEEPAAGSWFSVELPDQTSILTKGSTHQYISDNWEISYLTLQHHKGLSQQSRIYRLLQQMTLKYKSDKCEADFIISVTDEDRKSSIKLTDRKTIKEAVIR